MEPNPIGSLTGTSPTISPTLELDDRSNVNFESESEIDASNHQVLWTNIMGEGLRYKNSSGYTKVEVLMLGWAKGCGDLATHCEIEDLKIVFEKHFNYNTTVEYLDANQGSSLQLQVNCIVASFARMHNGPNTLLIVYYAGHGKPGDFHGDLKLFGSVNGSKNFELI